MGFTLFAPSPSFYGSTVPGTEFFTGSSAVSELVPDTFHVALGGLPFMIDFNQPFYRQYRRQLNQLVRTQADTSTEPGEQTMDPNSLWRRSFEDWSDGAGQRYLDRSPVASGQIGSVPNGFWASKGIDALTTKWQINLLPDTTQIRSSANSNLNVVVANGYIYISDGQHVAYASSVGGSFTNVAATPAVTCSSICTDGFNIWMAYGASGIYHTTAGSSSNADQWVTSAVDAAATISYSNGRLMVASTNKIYNIVAGTGMALPSALFTAGNLQNTPSYANFAEGVGAIYVGAVVGSRGVIYGMTVTSDGTALGAPVIQGTLPPGEYPTALYGYTPFLIVGTNLGIRMCQTSSSGGVTLGALIPTPAPVLCITAWQRWIYFGYTTYDSVSSGLGKLDLQNQVISNVLPAYCSDLMVTTQNAVQSVAVLNGQQVFSISGVGFYGPSTSLVSTGYIDSGYVMYDLTDNKVACLLDVQSLGPGNNGSFSAALSVDTGAFNSIGQHVQGQTTYLNCFNCGPKTGQRFEVRLTLVRDTNTASLGPMITRWTLRSYPAPSRPLTWQLPLILNESLVNKSSSSAGLDPLALLSQLETWATTGQVVSFQEGHYSHPVFVQDVEFLPDYTTERRDMENFFNGIALVTIVSLPITLSSVTI